MGIIIRILRFVFQKRFPEVVPIIIGTLQGRRTAFNNCELKREVLEGELSNKKKVVLPGLGAIGGMAVPAAIYIFLNSDDPIAMKGWAIPAATDIAFALGVLSLLGSRVPTSLKVFLTSLAIFDDIGAILIIAFFYTSKISLMALVVAAFCILIIFLLNKRGVVEKSLYIVVGVVMWIAMVKSGVHATLAGVILAMFIPLRSGGDPDISPLKSLENDLHPAVAFFILPVFAFCNAGINFEGLGMAQVLHSIPLGIALGLFIGSLAFEETGINLMDERLGIIMGSLASGISGYLILRASLRSNN
ncbi:MAG TPA: Na+/H+ antiporter NhaA [Nitrospirae bacterium]|nr:Na(+)/H(+) antiporter NhaA [bacterium BMS3Abin06]HDH11264.1 Na+/H+ antiporter NhaA [Nitrospirota bacterium]HDY99902.1 Na+/H+ antiporter NhaA [Nitrospirota bacterium]